MSLRWASAEPVPSAGALDAPLPGYAGERIEVRLRTALARAGRDVRVAAAVAGSLRLDRPADVPRLLAAHGLLGERWVECVAGAAEEHALVLRWGPAPPSADYGRARAHEARRLEEWARAAREAASR